MPQDTPQYLLLLHKMLCHPGTRLMGDEPPLIKFIHIVGQYLFRIQDLRIHFTDKMLQISIPIDSVSLHHLQTPFQPFP